VQPVRGRPVQAAAMLSQVASRRVIGHYLIPWFLSYPINGSGWRFSSVTVRGRQLTSPPTDTSPSAGRPYK